MLCCFDRIVFKGYLPLGWPDAMERLVTGPDPDEWEFRPVAFRYYGGEWIALRGIQWRFLKALAKFGKPLTPTEFAGALYGEGCDVDLAALKRSIREQLCGLRKKLRGWFGLPADVDPIPCLDPRNAAWTLYIPVDDHETKSGAA